MSRRGSVLGLVLGPAIALGALAGCSSSNKHVAPPATTTTVSTVAPSTTTASSTAAASTTTTSIGSTESSSTIPVTPTTANHGGLVITGFTVTPATPVCNTPTQIQLQWTANGATAVDLAIDGQQFATYGGGTQTHLEYFACDRQPHTYMLTAHAGAQTGTATKVVTGSTPSN